MKHKQSWWKLFLFAIAACAALFLFSPTNQFMLIVWMLVVYGVIAFWLKSHEMDLIETPFEKTRPAPVTPAEFFDEDRLYLQSQGDESSDDSLLFDPHEIV